MVSFRFSVVFWALLVLFAHIHSGYSLFLGIKKDLLKHKLYKLKEALFEHHDDDDYGEVHHVHYKSYPVYVSSGYSKYSPYSYSKYSPYAYSKWSPYSSYGGWSGSYGYH